AHPGVLDLRLTPLQLAKHSTVMGGQLLAMVLKAHLTHSEPVEFTLVLSPATKTVQLQAVQDWPQGILRGVVMGQRVGKAELSAAFEHPLDLLKRTHAVTAV